MIGGRDVIHRTASDDYAERRAFGDVDGGDAARSRQHTLADGGVESGGLAATRGGSQRFGVTDRWREIGAFQRDREPLTQLGQIDAQPVCAGQHRQARQPAFGGFALELRVGAPIRLGGSVAPLREARQCLNDFDRQGTFLHRVADAPVAHDTTRNVCGYGLVGLCVSKHEGRPAIASVAVTPRPIRRSFMKAMRMGLIPLVHGLPGGSALQG